LQGQSFCGHPHHVDIHIHGKTEAFNRMDETDAVSCDMIGSPDECFQQGIRRNGFRDMIDGLVECLFGQPSRRLFKTWCGGYFSGKLSKERGIGQGRVAVVFYDEKRLRGYPVEHGYIGQFLLAQGMGGTAEAQEDLCFRVAFFIGTDALGQVIKCLCTPNVKMFFEKAER
jgi:hypothetical protein